ncbi:MAG: DUF72 domain-containing protein [Planctomycetota bacterium]|nr:MAG: DUF72 domain-containing protein [Planctomycetota bacterium]
MAKGLARVRYGTSSWTAKGWSGTFYPPGTKPADQLAFYATQFDTVEADTTYYRAPTTALAQGWARKTPAGFALAAKFPRAIVHGGDGEKPDASRVLVPRHAAPHTEQFLAAMAELGAKCGPLVLQFPYFNKSAFAELGPFLERLDAYLAALPPSFRYAVEVRNKAWLVPQLTDVLRRHRAALVLVDLVYLPHPADVAKELDVVTAEFSYARLIGDRAAVEAHTTSFERIVLDQRARLSRWAEFLTALRERVIEIGVYANNHYAGHGPTTIRELRARVERGGA